MPKKRKEKEKSALEGAALETKKGKNNRVSSWFVRFFGKYDFRNEQQFARIVKVFIYVLLLLVQSLLLLQHLGDFLRLEKWRVLLPILINIVLFTFSVGMRFFVLKNRGWTVVFYILNSISAAAFLYISKGSYALIIYVLLLTEFYMSAMKNRKTIWVFVLCVPLYALIYTASILVPDTTKIGLMQLLRESIGAFILLTAHFLVLQIAVAFYRQFLKLGVALSELNESKRELEKAYVAVKEVSALEERQRIAKEIHDTAGHSLTTVIMQTESAKLIVETNPEEAKNKIIAANLQARHALEELRNSVHLLSGITQAKTLKDDLLEIIHESTDGTGINIRSEIEEVTASQAKHRFICNTLKEGIANALRHGGATAFWFECKAEDGEIYFLLSDNGKGVRLEKLQKGFGLTTMQERARSLGGDIRFLSEEGEGFEIQMELPMDTEE